MAKKKVTKKKHGGISGKPSIMRPCPFCGKKPNLIQHDDRGQKLFEVMCGYGNCIEAVRSGEKVTAELAIATWNSRA